MAKYKGFIDVSLFGSVRKEPCYRPLTAKTGVRVPLGTPAPTETGGVPRKARIAYGSLTPPQHSGTKQLEQVFPASGSTDFSLPHVHRAFRS